MRGDVALAGILFAAEDWASYEPGFRAELLAAAEFADVDDNWVVGPATGVLSGPMRVMLPIDEERPC